MRVHLTAVVQDPCRYMLNLLHNVVSLLAVFGARIKIA